ncbi:hypothetical protein NDU88_003744 [Pleurodeles waltl]|uniref:Uncharacterized protein n=1 Tax=Pleurodeles waltl TaxID=8319 RepID=A0AAV7M4Y3_PLEWA|nr:hypothetical protein NDU88_003744 [Pleurodeles waltl]
MKTAADRPQGETHDGEQDAGSERRTETSEDAKDQNTRHQEPKIPEEQDKQTKEPSHDPGGSWLTKVRSLLGARGRNPKTTLGKGGWGGVTGVRGEREKEKGTV